MDIATDTAPRKARKESLARGTAADPLYVQLAARLREEIVSGRFAVGTQLPTEDELGSRFAVSRYTVREALRRLREEGLVASRQGAGTIVAAPRAAEAYVLHAASINDLAAFATGAHLAIETMTMITIAPKLAAQIGVGAGEQWLEVAGIRRPEGDERLYSHTTYYIHRDYAAVARLLQRHTGPIFPLIEDMFAVTIVEVSQEIAAITADAALAQTLMIEEGAPVLDVRRTYRLADGKVAQVTVNLLPADRFRHSMTMKRVKA